MKKVVHPQSKDRGKFKKTKTEKVASNRNSTEKDTIDRKTIKHGSKPPGTMKKKPKEVKASRAFKNGPVSGKKVSSKDPAFKGKFPKRERKELKAKVGMI